MDFTSDMNLHSPSGYAMPFELPESSPLNITLGYGKQVHPKTKEEFFHHGVDFMVGKDTWLKALATGVVSGIGSDVNRGFNITVNYKNYSQGANGSYDVVYSHIHHSLCNLERA